MADEGQPSSAGVEMLGGVEVPLLPLAPDEAVPQHGVPSRARQFGAVLRKNYLLQTRSRRLWWAGAPWLALLIEVRMQVVRSRYPALQGCTPTCIHHRCRHHVHVHACAV